MFCWNCRPWWQWHSPVTVAPAGGQCALPHCKSCSRMAWEMWQELQVRNLVSKFPVLLVRAVLEQSLCMPHLATHWTQKICRQSLVARHHRTPPEVLCPCLGGSDPSLIRGRASMDRAWGVLGPQWCLGRKVVCVRWHLNECQESGHSIEIRFEQEDQCHLLHMSLVCVCVAIIQLLGYLL